MANDIFQPPPDINTTAVYLLLGRLEKGVEIGFGGVHDRLDRLNGRIASAEQKIAILEDRAGHAMTRTARWWSFGISGALAAIMEALRHFKVW